MWLGSSAIYYSLVSPAYSHASSMLAAGLFTAVWGKGPGRWGGNVPEAPERPEVLQIMKTVRGR